MFTECRFPWDDSLLARTDDNADAKTHAQKHTALVTNLACFLHRLRLIISALIWIAIRDALVNGVPFCCFKANHKTVVGQLNA